MTLLQLIDPAVCGRICLTLLHSLWIAPLMCALAWLAGRGSIQRGYLAHVAALLAILIALPVTYILATPPAPPLQLSSTSNESPIQSSNQISQSAAPSVAIDTDERLALEVPAAIPTGTAVSEPAFDTVESGSPLWMRWAPWVTCTYIVGVLLMLGRLGFGLVSASRLASSGKLVRDERLLQLVERLRLQWLLCVAPALRHSQQIVTPKVVGLVRPTILLPTAALSGLSLGELEMILAHELAHVRRHDMWVNLLQRLAEAVLFFNPALWFLSRRIGALREYCCDELACEVVVQTSGEPRLRYAEALLHTVQLNQKQAGSSAIASLAASGRGPSELRRRVSRLIGEPVREPIKLSRGGFVAVVIVALMLLTGPAAWTTPAADESTSSAETNSFDEPIEADLDDGAADESNREMAKLPPLPPMSDADRVVAAARAKSAGIETREKFSLSGVQTGGVVQGMKNLPALDTEPTMLNLWIAQGGELSDEARYLKRVRIAWSNNKLLLISNLASPGGPTGNARYSSREEGESGESNPFTSSQIKYWEGAEGWSFQSFKGESRFVGRYSEPSPMFDESDWYDLPYSLALGNQLPWSGAAIGLEHELPPELTRYKKVGSEQVEGTNCDVYEGPARSEKLWIDPITGLIRAKCRHYLIGEQLPNYLSELVSEIAGRTFDSEPEYRDWFEQQSPELRARLSAHWSAAHWHLTKPGSLFVYSNYEELSPGVQWPMRCDRLVVHSHNGASKYYRNTTTYQTPEESFDFDDLAEKASPRQGDKVTDWRFDVPVQYLWSEDITETQISEWLVEKRKQNPRRVGDWKQASPSVAPTSSTQKSPAGDPPAAQIIGEHFLLCPVTTDVQRSLLGNSQRPAKQATACLLVNASAFERDEIDEEMSGLAQLEVYLSEYKTREKGEVRVRLIDPGQGDMPFDERRE